MGIADSYATLAVFGMMAPHDAYPRARRAAQQALEIEPDLAAAHATLGHIAVQYDLDWQAGMAEYDRAIALDPAYARTYHWRGISYAMHGATARALADFERARQLEPLWIAPRAATGNALFYARRYPEAIAELSEALEFDERADNARTFRARAYLHSGQRELALAEFLQLREREARTPGSFGDVGQALAMLGRTDEARAELARACAREAAATCRRWTSPPSTPASEIATKRFNGWSARLPIDRPTSRSWSTIRPSTTLHDDPRFIALVERISARKRKDLWRSNGDREFRLSATVTSPMMNTWKGLAAVLLTAIPLGAAAAGNVVQTEQVRAELVAHAPEGVAPHKIVWLGLKLEHIPHWHTYWKNAGDSGLPTTLRWTLPAGVTAGEIDWPAPQRLPIGPLLNFGYEGTVLLPVPVTVSSLIENRAMHALKLDADWLVCKIECIPQYGTFELDVPVDQPTVAHTDLFEQALAARPANVIDAKAIARVADNALRFEVRGLPSDVRNREALVFPEIAGVVENPAPVDSNGTLTPG